MIIDDRMRIGRARKWTNGGASLALPGGGDLDRVCRKQAGGGSDPFRDEEVISESLQDHAQSVVAKNEEVVRGIETGYGGRAEMQAQACRKGV